MLNVNNFYYVGLTTGYAALAISACFWTCLRVRYFGYNAPPVQYTPPVAVTVAPERTATPPVLNYRRPFPAMQNENQPDTPPVLNDPRPLPAMQNEIQPVLDAEPEVPVSSFLEKLVGRMRAKSLGKSAPGLLTKPGLANKLAPAPRARNVSQVKSNFTVRYLGFNCLRFNRTKSVLVGQENQKIVPITQERLFRNNQLERVVRSFRGIRDISQNKKTIYYPPGKGSQSSEDSLSVTEKKSKGQTIPGFLFRKTLKNPPFWVGGVAAWNLKSILPAQKIRVVAPVIMQRDDTLKNKGQINENLRIKTKLVLLKTELTQLKTENQKLSTQPTPSLSLFEAAIIILLVLNCVATQIKSKE